ncbi:hypothetical protein FDECE_3997, partial [Fusarium decemcellulare]
TRAVRARSISSTAGSGSPNNTKDSRWTTPERKTGASSTELAPDPAHEFAQWKTDKGSTDQGLNPLEEQSRKHAISAFSPPKPPGRTSYLLTIEGLPTSLRPSDFHLLIPKSLSDWASAIEQVHQERDPWTLEPLGTYRISFSSASAAELYQAKVNRLFQLAQIKLHSTNGLWSSKVPVSIRGDGNLEEELATFTLAPGSYPAPIICYRSRVKGKWPWQRLVEELIQRSGYVNRPAAVLLELQSSKVQPSELQELIEKDGVEQNHHWTVSVPYHLGSLSKDPVLLTNTRPRVPRWHDPSFCHKANTRYVLICKSSAVAHRFIRRWHQRIIEVERGEYENLRTIVTASILDI